MKRAEQIQKAAAYFAAGIDDWESREDVEDAFAEGAEFGYNLAINKACEWLNEYCRYGCCEYIEKNEFINDFKKAMQNESE